MYLLHEMGIETGVQLDAYFTGSSLYRRSNREKATIAKQVTIARGEEQSCQTSIKVDVEDGIAILTLMRAEAANALSIQMMHEMNEALETIQYDRSIRVVIVTGDGEKAFCAGADLKERKG